jgi:hypothetical protein
MVLETYIELLKMARTPQQKSSLMKVLNAGNLAASRPQLTKNTPPGFAGNAYAMNSRRGGLGPYAARQPLQANRRRV